MSSIKSDVTLLWEPGVDRSEEMVPEPSMRGKFSLLNEDPLVLKAARKELERIAKARRDDPTWEKQRKYEDRIEFIDKKIEILSGKIDRLHEERSSKRRVLKKLQKEFWDNLAKEQLEKG